MPNPDGHSPSDVSCQEQVFYPSAVPLFVLMASLAGIGCFGLLLLTEGPNILLIGIAIAGVVLVYQTFIWTRRLAALHTVRVRPGGLRVYGLRGGPVIDNHWLEWSAITRVSRFHVPFNPCLVLRSRLNNRRYWIPAKLINAEQFRELVHMHAGRMHPLTQALYA